MWADPVDNDSGALESQDEMTKNNDARGCSYYFGYKLAKSFLSKNGLLSVIRAHEAQANGFKMYHWGGQKQFPTVITIFSAPNYCDFYNNKGAVIKFKVKLTLSRTIPSTSNNFYRTNIPISFLTSWMFLSGVCPLSLKRFHKCFII
jgi:serine/threonine-protein phosphatase 2B catalytic subunit